nr:MAG TPA: hypothetical protein [Caudoviricetes sp.]
MNSTKKIKVIYKKNKPFQAYFYIHKQHSFLYLISFKKS